MRLEDLNWMDVERYLERDDRIMLITGTTEQHAYLSLLTDILIPSRLALAVAEREPILIAPPLNFGYSHYFKAYPGTISLRQETFAQVLNEIVDGLRQQGFRRFFILNGHGGNLMPQHLTDLHASGQASLVWYNWWKESAVKAFEEQHNIKLTHANWGENFPFNRVAESPAGEKAWIGSLNQDDPQAVRAVLGDGSFGGAYQVADDITHALFMTVVDEIVARIRAM